MWARTNRASVNATSALGKRSEAGDDKKSSELRRIERRGRADVPYHSTRLSLSIIARLFCANCLSPYSIAHGTDATAPTIVRSLTW